MLVDKVKIVGLLAVDRDMGMVFDTGALSHAWDVFATFKEESAYTAVIMSEQVYLNKPVAIPDRLNIVISTKLPLDTPGVIVVRNLNEAYNAGYERSQMNNTSIYMVLDKTLYDLCKEHLSELCVCHLDASFNSRYPVSDLPNNVRVIDGGSF